MKGHGTGKGPTGWPSCRSTTGSAMWRLVVVAAEKPWVYWRPAARYITCMVVALVDAWFVVVPGVCVFGADGWAWGA